MNKSFFRVFLALLVSVPLSGCSIGSIKLVEKIPDKSEKTSYGELKEDKNSDSTDKESLVRDEISVSKDSDIVASADGYVFKKEEFTVSPANDTVYTTRPKGGKEKSVRSGTYLKVIGVSDDRSIYIIDVNNKYFFIKADKTVRETAYDENIKKMKEEEEKKKAEEQKKIEDQRKKQEEEERKKSEEEKKKKEAEKRNTESYSRSSQNSSKKPSTNNKNSSTSSTPQNSSSQGHVQSFTSQPSVTYNYYTPTQVSETYREESNSNNIDNRPSNIIMPNISKREYVGNIAIAVVNKTVYVNEQAPMNTFPGEAYIGTNIYTYAYLNAGSTMTITGITENGYVRTIGPNNTILYVHGRYLSEQ